MKYSKLFTTVATLSVLASFPSPSAFAADGDKSNDTEGLVDASKLDDHDVWDFHGNKLGHMQHVLVDPKSGRIRYGVLEVDKSWNWSDPTVAIPWGSFAVKQDDGDKMTLSIDATKEKLEKAPKFKDGDADRLYDKTAGEPVYTYWGIYWVEDSMPMQDKERSSSNTKASDQTSDSTPPVTSTTTTPATPAPTPAPSGDATNK